MKKTRFILLASFAMLFALSFAAILDSCKKRDDNTKPNDDTNVGSIIGKWYNETEVGVDGVAMTTLEFTDNNTLHVTVNYSNLVKEDGDNLDFTLPYEVNGNILRITYDYKDVEDFEYVDEDEFEIKDNAVLTFVENITDDADGIFLRIE